jgi:hypothetical protein
MSENVVQAEILLAIGRLPNAIFWRNQTGALPSRTGRVVRFGLIGSPDIIGCVNGRFVGIEVKSSTGKQREAQANFQRAFEKAGGIYILARSASDAVSAIEAANA